MKRALICLLLLPTISACPLEPSGPEPGELEPLAFDPKATPPPPPPAPAPAAKPAPAPVLPEVNTCCVFGDGNRMKGLTLEECEASSGTFDPECKKEVEVAAPAKDDDVDDGSCCIFPGNVKKMSVPRAVCDEADGVFKVNCD